MGERTPRIGVVAVAAAGLGICCAVPLLVSLGVLGLVAGLSTSTWILIVVGAATALLGGWRVLGRERRACLEPSACRPGAAHQPDTETTLENPTLQTEH